MVTGAGVADVYVFDGAEGLLLEVTPQPDTWSRIGEAWDRFDACVVSRSPPPLARRATSANATTSSGLKAAAAYVDAKRTADAVQRTLDDAKGRLIALTSHSSEAGGGVTVTRYWRKGSIDYSKIEELKAMDLEQFRQYAENGDSSNGQLTRKGLGG